MATTGQFQFEAVDEIHNVTGTYIYDDTWFEEDASVLSPRLRLMSMCMSLASFPNPEDRKRPYSNAESLLMDLGFEDVEVNKDFQRAPEEFTIGVIAARKEVTLHGEDCTIYVIGFRGASYGREWYGNTIIEARGIPIGFRIALDKTVKFLKDYTARHESDHKRRRRKLWITGFSRAGAAAGLAGAAVTRHAASWGYRKEDIFVYTFESPRCMPKELNADCPNIHNTVSKTDMVPLIAPMSWGFERPGVDDTVLPSPRHTAWQERIREVRSVLNSVNPGLESAEEGFTPLAISGTRITPIRENREYHEKRGKLEKWWYEADIGDYFPNFIRFMGSKLSLSVGKPYLTDREAYANYYERSFGIVAKKYLGSDADQHEIVRGVLEDIYRRAALPPIRAVLFVILKRGKNRALRRVASRITAIILFRIMTAKGFRGSRRELAHMRVSIENMVYYFLFCASCDVRENDFAYFGTLGENIGRLRGAHSPELIYSWLFSLYVSPM